MSERDSIVQDMKIKALEVMNEYFANKVEPDFEDEYMFKWDGMQIIYEALFK